MTDKQPAKGAIALGYDAAPRSFNEVAVLPEEGDNCAIARRVIDAGTVVQLSPESAPVTIHHTILEGHRFATRNVAVGQHLLSWGLVFGEATHAMAPGDYVVNDRVLASLKGRRIKGAHFPEHGNFNDLIVPMNMEQVDAEYAPAEQVPLLPSAADTWMGYSRSADRGSGTRNFIILIGATSVTAGYVRALEDRIKATGMAAGFPNVDGVVAVAHTEGGGSRDDPSGKPHNFELLCGTLTGFMVHPNVAAALVVDYGSANEALWTEDLQEYAQKHSIPLGSVPHRFLRLTGDLEVDLATGGAAVEGWLPGANAVSRTPQPFTALSVAQQCGGSDAFSGVSGNPCAGEACKLLIQRGGQAVLAETDELMGAESYILRKVKDLGTSHKFLDMINRFKERLAWHGQSAESNPSGGNNYRGLYNIGLKSLGAAKKKHADVRLDGVLEYGERTVAMDRGYYMMDSPGNDLESIAGQVSTGCNLIYFITGNGSITNFPFVPTIKIVTTTARFELLKNDMDFNAGRYQEGTSMAQLGQELFDLTERVASGEHSIGEKAGHAQVSIWRNWPQAAPLSSQAAAELSFTPKGGVPLQIKTGAAPSATTSSGSGAGEQPGTAPRDAAALSFYGFPSARFHPCAPSVERIGLILPTSLCSGEVARKITAKLNASIAAHGPLGRVVSRVECLPHTEGCGTGYPAGGIEMYNRVMLGHLTHPAVHVALCLEHGCEKTHNDFFTEQLQTAGIEPSQFGYASIQLDGGIEKVTGRVLDYFEAQAAAELGPAGGEASNPSPTGLRVPLDVRALSIGLITSERLFPQEVALLAAALVRAFAGAGGTVVIPATSPLLKSGALAEELGTSGAHTVPPTLAFGQKAVSAPGGGGLHIMDMPEVRDWSETVTGLAATGVHAVLALSLPPRKGHAKVTNGHPIVPVVHVGLRPDPEGSGEPDAGWAATTDAVLTARAGASPEETAAEWAEAVLRQLAKVASGTMRPKASSVPFFNITRGPMGVST